MRAVLALACGVVSVLLSAYAVGAQDTRTPSEVITLPAMIIEERRPASDLAAESSSRTVLERATLAQSEERDLNSVFRGLPGVSMQIVGSRGQLSTLFVRGASSGLGQLVFDGVPLYSPLTNSFNLAPIPTDALERVEVVRGASSPRYGSRALGGVILLTSREARANTAFLRLEGGSYGTLSETAGGSLVGTRAWVSATASRDDIFADISAADRRNGNREGDDFYSTQGVGRVTLRPFDHLVIDSSLLYKHSRADLDRGGVLPTGQVGLVDDLNAFAHDETWVAQTTAHGRVLSGWESSLQLGFTHNHAHGVIFALPFGFDNQLFLARWKNTQQLYSGVADHTRPAPHLALGWGAEVQHKHGANRFDLPDRSLHDTRTLVSGLLELQGEAGPWAGVVGTSLDRYDDLGTHPTLYAGLSRWVTATIKLRASGGRGYRPPAFQELYFIPLFGNPNLRPEQGWSADLGFDWLPKRGTRLSVTGYYARFDDLIQLVVVPTPSFAASENVPHARLQGVEIEAVHDWGYGVTTGLDYTYTDSRNLDTHRVLPHRPHHQGRAYAEWQIRALPLTSWLELVYRGSHVDDSQAVLRVGDGVYLNAQVRYQFSPHLRLYLRGENLTNDRTPEIFSFGVRGAAYFAGVHLGL
jgi:outer membrane cobalamin receptor